MKNRKKSNHDRVKSLMMAELPNLLGNMAKSCETPALSSAIGRLKLKNANTIKNDAGLKLSYIPIFGHSENIGELGKECWVWRILLVGIQPLWVVFYPDKKEYKLAEKPPNYSPQKYQP